jgi:hypothetical protein
MKNKYLFFFLLFFMGSCAVSSLRVYDYKTTSHSPSILFETSKLTEYPQTWNFYVHDGYGRAHKVDSISLDSSSINTILETPSPIELPVKLQPSEYIRKQEVHVFVKKLNLDTKSLIELQASDVENVVMYTSPELEVENQDSAKSDGKTVLTVLGIFFGAIAAVFLLIFLAFQALFNSSGCYIATMAYGSYEASEVLVLRRFRDEKLKQSFLGKVFIANYYAFSPLLVKFVQKTGFAERLIRRKLDGFVYRLRTKNDW